MESSEGTAGFTPRGNRFPDNGSVFETGRACPSPTSAEGSAKPIPAGSGGVTEDARWLDEQEQRTWRSFLWTFQQLQDALERQLQRDSSMPHAYYMILAMLSEAPDRSLTMTDLAEITRFSASRLSHAVARLEEAGHVRRVKHPSDRRTTIAQLTDGGFAALTRAAPGHVEEVRRRLFDPLSPEQLRQLADIVETLKDGFESHQDTPGLRSGMPHAIPAATGPRREPSVAATGSRAREPRPH